MAMPVAKTGVSTAPLVQEAAYRRHVGRAYRGHATRRYGYNPGPALFGAMAGIIGSGIAASQQPSYYYPAYPYPYGGYGYPYYGY